MMMAAVLLATLPWFGLSVGPQRGRCVELAYVQPGQPAASAGLKAGDCVVAVDTKPVRDTDGLATTLRSTAPWSQVRVALVDGRTLTLTPSERTEEMERKYCEYLGSLRTEIHLMVAGKGGRDVHLSLPPPITLGALRKQFTLPETVRVTAGDKCAKTPPLVTDDPPDNFVVPDGATMIFGYENARLFRLPRVLVDSASELR